METMDVAFIGTGDPDGDGFAMAYEHANAYDGIDSCDLVACADLVPENAERFAEAYGVEAYTDHEEMLASVDPDAVSITVPPLGHAPLTIDCAEAGVEMVHCEKPMAMTWGEAKQMTEACTKSGTQLTFNHQRRFSKPWVEAKELLEDGQIGTLERVEASASDFFDWGTHLIDLCHMFVDEMDVEWVIGQFDARDGREMFGVPLDNHGLVQWSYSNGVHALTATGDGGDMVGCRHRLHGTDGIIEVRPNGGPDLRWRTAGDAEWSTRDYGGDWRNPIHAAIQDAVEAARNDRASPLRAENALRATEVIFAGFESARSRGRIETPLQSEDNAFQDLLSRGAFFGTNPEN